MCQKESCGAIVATKEAHSTQRGQPPRMHGPGLSRYQQGRRPRGDWEDASHPKKFEVGDGPCIGPPIFREVVLWDGRESSNRVKK